MVDFEWMYCVGIGGVYYFDVGGVLVNYSFIMLCFVVGDVNWCVVVNFVV